MRAQQDQNTDAADVDADDVDLSADVEADGTGDALGPRAQVSGAYDAGHSVKREQTRLRASSATPAKDGSHYKRLLCRTAPLSDGLKAATENGH